VALCHELEYAQENCHMLGPFRRIGAVSCLVGILALAGAGASAAFAQSTPLDEHASCAGFINQHLAQRQAADDVVVAFQDVGDWQSNSASLHEFSTFEGCFDVPLPPVPTNP
jgi:hypothetical protein